MPSLQKSSLLCSITFSCRNAAKWSCHVVSLLPLCIFLSYLRTLMSKEIKFNSSKLYIDRRFHFKMPSGIDRSSEFSNRTKKCPCHAVTLFPLCIFLPYLKTLQSKEIKFNSSELCIDRRFHFKMPSKGGPMLWILSRDEKCPCHAVTLFPPCTFLSYLRSLESKEI